jgi:hypothetical protein
MRKLIGLVLVAVVVGGCGMIKPETRITVNPSNGNVNLYNSKDVNVKAEKIEAKNGDKTLAVENLDISDKSSPVIEQNVKQMLAFVEQQRAANEGIAITLSGVSQIIKEIVPFLNLTPNTLAAVLNQLKEVDARLATTYGTLELGSPPTSTTQPAK